MAEESNGRTNGATDECILVAVRDEGDESRGQASLIANIGRAERIVAALVEAGVEPEAVSALRAREIPLKVSYRWDVEISSEDTAQQRSRPRAPQPRMAQPRRAQARNDRASGFLRQGLGLLKEAAPQHPFQLRFDRLVWLGLWAASLLILGISLISSLSKGAAREFVIAPSSFEEESSPGAAVEVGAVSDDAPVVGEASRVPPCIAGGINTCQCQDFATQGEAQAFFGAYPAGPGHVIDPDVDGVLCEWLPVSTSPPAQ
jgi:hypothetical protein